jgi:hypothetical protein
VYPHPEVARFIADSFVPVRVHVREQAADYKRLGERFGAHWTPTTLIVDRDGTERHRLEGFLPVDEYLAQLQLGLGRSAFARGAYLEARERFDAVLERYAETEAAPEAQYWTGVSTYKHTGDAAALVETARRFTERYADSVWAKKSSVWKR